MSNIPSLNDTDVVFFDGEAEINRGMATLLWNKDNLIPPNVEIVTERKLYQGLNGLVTGEVFLSVNFFTSRTLHLKFNGVVIDTLESYIRGKGFDVTVTPFNSFPEGIYNGTNPQPSLGKKIIFRMDYARVWSHTRAEEVSTMIAQAVMMLLGLQDLGKIVLSARVISPLD